jgi:RNA methyltransferase, TrmH family
VLEGRVLLAEAVAAGVEIEAVFVAPGADPGSTVDAPVHELAPGVLERVASTDHPQPVLAVARLPRHTLQDLAAATFLVVGAGVADPGNAGTLARTAEAAGADGLVLTAGSVDPWAHKVVRASAGAVLHLPVVDGVALGEVRRLGVRLLGTAATGGTPYDRVDWLAPFALVLGNEAHGLAPDELDQLDELVTIPHAGRAESLNVAMAGAVCCFEASRCRRTGAAG